MLYTELNNFVNTFQNGYLEIVEVSGKLLLQIVNQMYHEYGMKIEEYRRMPCCVSWFQSAERLESDELILIYNDGTKHRVKFTWMDSQ